jgi:hypothetical protein
VTNSSWLWQDYVTTGALIDSTQIKCAFCTEVFEKGVGIMPRIRNSLINREKLYCSMWG